MTKSNPLPVMQQLAAHNAAFQLIRGAFYKLSNNERAMVWNLAREKWEQHRAHHMKDIVSVVDLIESNIKETLARKGKLVESAGARQALTEFSQLFAEHAAQLVGKPDLRQAYAGAYVHLLEKAVTEHWRQRNE